MELSRSLTEIRDGDITVVAFGTELKHLDELNVDGICEQLIQLCDTLPRPVLILDLSVTDFFGSSFIEVLFRIWKKLNTKPEALFGIAGLQIYCREVLEITHLDSLWPLFETRDAAVAAFKKSLASS